MAIFSLSVSCVQRSAGSSAIASASYIIDRTLYDASLDREFRFGSDTSRKHETTLDLGSRLPDGTAIDTERLWNAAEQSERKSNARTARKIMIALPVELTREQHIEAVNKIRQELEKQYNVATTAGIHYEHEHNPHCHLMMTTREVKREEGKLYFGEKTRALDDKKTGPLEIERIREQWELTCNIALEKARERARIDRRSYERQGIRRTPGIHIGMRSYALLRKNRYSDRIERAADIGRIREIEKEIADARELYRLQMERLKQRTAGRTRARLARQAAIERSYRADENLDRRLERSRRETKAGLQEAGFKPERDIAENTGNIDTGRSGRSLSVADLIEAGRSGSQDREIGAKTIGEILAGLDRIKGNREIKTAADLLEESRHGKRQEMDRSRTHLARDL